MRDRSISVCFSVPLLPHAAVICILDGRSLLYRLDRLLELLDRVLQILDLFFQGAHLGCIVAVGHRRNKSHDKQERKEHGGHDFRMSTSSANGTCKCMLWRNSHEQGHGVPAEAEIKTEIRVGTRKRYKEVGGEWRRERIVERFGGMS